MTLKELTDEAVDYIVKNMDTVVLTKWELGFFENVADRWTRDRQLPDGTKLKLGEIWDKQP